MTISPRIGPAPASPAYTGSSPTARRTPNASWTWPVVTVCSPSRIPGCLRQAKLSAPTHCRLSRSRSGNGRFRRYGCARICVDAGARDRLGRKLAEHLARVPFHLRPSDENPLTFRYCPPTLSAALWQRFIAESLDFSIPHAAPRPSAAAGSSAATWHAQTSVSAPTRARIESFAGTKNLSRSLLFESFVDCAPQLVSVCAHLAVPSALLLISLVFVLNQVCKPIELE